ncbi:hypothetical protein ABMB67_002400 [Halalkalibacter oceani]
MFLTMRCAPCFEVPTRSKALRPITKKLLKVKIVFFSSFVYFGLYSISVIVIGFQYVYFQFRILFVIYI